MEKILVVGAGFMGCGIAQVCAQSGRRIYLMDVSKNGLAMSVDFGDGTCDSEIAVIYPDGYTEQINL